MKSRKLGIALLALLALVTTTGTFAYWAAGISSDTDVENATVTIGTGETVTATLTIGSDTNTGVLAPAGLADVSEVESLDFTFTVDIDTGGDADGLTSQVSIQSWTATNPSSADVSAIFNVSATPVNITTGTQGSITVTITMNEPADQAAYNSVAGLNITFAITFVNTAVSS